jgi:hypothetical protein
LRDLLSDSITWISLNSNGQIKHLLILQPLLTGDDARTGESGESGE